MKKIIAIAFLVVLTLSALPNRTQAQAYSKSIGADPLGLAFGLFNATFESKISSTNSFTLFGSYWTYVDWSAYGFGGSYRWYFDLNDGKRPITGLSAGPFASVGFWTWGGPSYIDYSGGTSFAIGGEVAYKWVFGGFVVEPILRLALPVSKVNGLNYTSFGLGCTLGYAW